jgi:hypothetical protein
MFVAYTRTLKDYLIDFNEKFKLFFEILRKFKE